MYLLLFQLSAFAYAVRSRSIESVEVVWTEEVPQKKLHPNTIYRQMNQACLRKKNLSLEQANRIVDRCALKGELMYFYKCRYCGSHHMTKSEPREIEQKFSLT